MQLLHQYSPLAATVLVVMVPLMEPIGLVDHHPGPDTLLGYPYSMASLAAIAASSVLGLAVSLTTFLVIGSTSSLTYNLCGHLKTVTILAGGCLFFGEGSSLSLAGCVRPLLATCPHWQPPACSATLLLCRRMYRLMALQLAQHRPSQFLPSAHADVPSAG